MRRLEGSGLIECTENCVILRLLYVCRSVGTDIREEDVVAMDKGCHGVGLRKQHLGYHNSWEYWCFMLLV
jgi:hypothetical protein